MKSKEILFLILESGDESVLKCIKAALEFMVARRLMNSNTQAIGSNS